MTQQHDGFPPFQDEGPFRDEEEDAAAASIDEHYPRRQPGIASMELSSSSSNVPVNSRRRFALWHVVVAATLALLLGLVVGNRVGSNNNNNNNKTAVLTSTTSSSVDDNGSTTNQATNELENEREQHKEDNNNNDDDYPNYENTSYCPKVQCANTDLCQPCRHRFLFVFSVERAASATLMHMLEALPGIRMAGEDDNALGALQELMANNLEDPSFQTHPDDRHNQNHNFIPPQTGACAAQGFLKALNPPRLQTDHIHYLGEDNRDSDSDILAFTSSQFLASNNNNNNDDNHPQDPNAMARFIKHNFPCSRILLNLCTDVEHLAKSYLQHGFNNAQDQSLSEITTHIVERQNLMTTFARYMGPVQAKVIDKTKWTSNITMFNQEVVQWLGFDANHCQFQEYLHLHDSGTDGLDSQQAHFSNNGQHPLLSDNCTSI